ncbi:uncharacterized protein A4U43_C05F17750 [Asparagus officinalis]|uniref:Pentatricopeptide repeat-containing protein n=1 Tax=Asparagus officinalis TaxID=4686 RepID=A0A5P1ESG8_ASPOF|nr:pentatricopeptide repeat-containing protein At2g03380, mitochondrial-like [Asparagus officinalis]ONK68952.1 uncharacterized protein A4U43_C05F17750 [Asparagus officinalis]
MRNPPKFSKAKEYRRNPLAISQSHLHPYTSPLNSSEKPKYPFLYLLDYCTDPFSVKKIHTHRIVHGLTQILPFQTKLLSSYGSLGNTKYARLAFDRIPSPDLYSCKAMLKCYVMNGCFDKSIGFYWYMRECDVEYDNVVFSLLLKACIKLVDLDEGKKLHCLVVKVGNPDIFLLNVFVDMYAKCGDLDSSVGVFEEIPHPNVVSWASVITGCNQNYRPESGLLLFNRMRLVDIEPEEHIMGSLLTSCSMVESPHQGKWIHGFVLKTGMCMNAFVATSLLDMYIKCGEVTDSRAFFDELDDIDLVLWTAMIVGYTQKAIRGIGRREIISGKFPSNPLELLAVLYEP